MKNIEDLKDLEELAVLKNQVEEVRLKDNLGKQTFLRDLKKIFDPVTKSLDNTSQEITETIVETSNNNNKALEILNNKLLGIMNDRGILASYLTSPLSKITNPENATQFRLVKDYSSNRVNDLFIHNSIPISFHENLLTFCDTAKVFELKGDLLKMIRSKNYNVNFASLLDKKLVYDFAKVTIFDLNAQSNESTRDRTLIKLLNSPALRASGISTVFLSSDPDFLCTRLKFFLQEKEARNISDMINEEIFALVYKLLEYKCLSRKQQKKILIKGNLLHERV